MKGRNLIGINLKKYRKLKKLSQRDFVTKLTLLGLNIDQSSFCRIETLQREVYDYEVVYFAKVLNIDVSDLYENTTIY
ncbi:hypothetical protein B2H97_00760 [Paraclostridium bifermentans]|uniref:hypothetical protein n=1 Tax=Paraclostridium bifermentans TaxID=1490 RepID=UPI000A16F205|nr:hypothetical protein [Paraclostridium bifermentans]OSB11671.1 hypothetical protein B2H97_00760 [Paraclostridium bifermentans]